MEWTMSDGINLVSRKWEAEDSKAVLLLVHGMAEHIDRYHFFADYLAQNQVTVYGYDQRGHGKTAGSVDRLGYFGKAGWERVVEDVNEVILRLQAEHPELPIFLMGHSMGSFVVRNYLHHHGHLNGVIISGTGGNPGFQGQLLKNIAKLQVAFKGEKTPSTLIDGLTNKTFMKKIKSPDTNCDWLSRDKVEVKKYVDDPYCGTVFSTSFYRDLFQAVIFTNSVKCVENYPKQLPIYIFSGDHDPVGEYGKGVNKVADLLRITGQEDVKVKLYPEGRHEMLNELNRHEVYSDILEWINSKL